MRVLYRLENLSKLHRKNGHTVEAAVAMVHVAAMVTEYFRLEGYVFTFLNGECIHFLFSCMCMPARTHRCVV